MSCRHAKEKRLFHWYTWKWFGSTFDWTEEHGQTQEVAAKEKEQSQDELALT
jgi:hypothetical protein